MIFHHIFATLLSAVLEVQSESQIFTKNSGKHRQSWRCDGVLQQLCPMLPGRWLQAEGLLHVPRNICSGAQSHQGKRRKFKISEDVPRLSLEHVCENQLWSCPHDSQCRTETLISLLRNLKLELKSRKEFYFPASPHLFLLPFDNYKVFMFFCRKNAPRKFIDSCSGIIKKEYLSASQAN